MTLRQQFSLLTTVLVLILLGGSLLLTLGNGRLFFQQQLDARAYDAATALALSMSNIDNDEQRLRLMDVMFDRGFFRRIELQLPSGQTLSRRAEVALENSAPPWFKQWVELNTLPATTDVMRGWQRLGVLTVESHTDFAYRDLWAMVRQETLWFAAVTMIALVLLHMLLRWLFKPLVRVEQQALALSERRWELQPKLPRARELKRVVMAMNRTVSTLKRIFSEQAYLAERLRSEAFHDDVTGLLNRRAFDQQLSHRLNDGEGHSGVLLLLQLQDFADINQQFGRSRGDELLQSVAQAFQQWLPGGCLCGRRSGADFCVYIDCVSSEEAQQWLQQCHDMLLNGSLNQRQPLPFHIGAIWLQGTSADISDALSGADEALRQAQRQGQTAVQLLQSTPQQAHWSAGHWQQQLLQALEQKSVELLFIPVMSRDNTRRLTQLEVVSRLRCGEHTLPGARFWPMVEHHQLAAEFDLLIIEQTLQAMASQAEALNDDVTCCVNLSPATIAEESAQQRLLALLSRYPQACRQLALEIPEFAVSHTETALQRLADRVKDLGVALGVDQMGRGNQAFSYLQRLPLDYVRIAGHLNRGVHAAVDQRFYLESMVQIAHSRELNVFAEGVEQQVDVDAVLQAGVDGVSGYFFAAPQSSLAALLR
ncbi:hypothetical protein CHH28_09740 [Bacterioplanes sanyensis]|uniref:GGDEF domain-containing protein n=1 Tax=Bacterioplanes sanyensis TaxID=1249553 RepID=A0A222FIT3_9GAMM|nr:EAL domain-containing protein [Bacterioplanes sanyensis]ASP38945.1 hypothetical protein CHH28_09740 [Bacterioplanes sanyensis]